MKKSRFDEIVDERLNAIDFAEPDELTQREKVIAIIALLIIAAVLLFLIATTY